MAFKFIFVLDEHDQLVEVIREGDRTAPALPTGGTNPRPGVTFPGAEPSGRVDLPSVQSLSGDVLAYFVADQYIQTSTRLTDQQKAEARQLLQSSLPGDYIAYARADPLYRRAGDSPKPLKPLFTRFIDP